MRFRIKDRQKFNRFIGITFILTTLFIYGVFSMINLNIAEGSSNNRDSVIVKYGDSVWSIAEEIDSHRDIREVVYDIKSLNNMDSTTLHPGDKLYIPSY